MTEILIFIYISINLYVAYTYFKLDFGVFQFPFLIACVSLTFVTPQLVNLLKSGYFIQDGIDEVILLNLCLCNIALTIGFNTQSNKKNIVEYSIIRLDNRKLLERTIYVFFLVGSIATLMNRGVYKGGFVSGTFVIISFFTSFGTIALLLILIAHQRGILKGKIFVILSVIIIVLTLDKIIASGRRAATINLVLMILYFFLNRKSSIYTYLKICVPAFFVIGMILGSQIGKYRETAYQGNKTFIENISSLDFSSSEIDARVLQKGEIYNAFEGMRMIYLKNIYDYGAYNWNGIVKDYIPTALFSKEFKNSLMIKEESQDLVNYLTRSGSTMTGYFDSFLSFGILGFIKFWIMGTIMGFLWRRRNQSDLSILLYFSLLTPGLHVLTHSSNYFVSEYVFEIIFIYPMLKLQSSKEIIFE